MLLLTNTLQDSGGPRCTKAQARQLLEELRAAYQALSPVGQGLVKNVLGRIEHAQLLLETD